MFCLWHVIVSTLVMAFCGWCKNIWPTDFPLRKAVSTRILWWSLPFGLIAYMNGENFDHTLLFMLAIFISSWIPKASIPDIKIHWTTMISDLALALLRNVTLLLLPTLIFWYYGKMWYAMIGILAGYTFCVLLGNIIPKKQILGLSTTKNLTLFLFHASIGFWLAIGLNF